MFSAKYYYDYQSKEVDVGRRCSGNGDEKYVQKFDRKFRSDQHGVELGVDRKII
jgi:hypothetical protein